MFVNGKKNEKKKKITENKMKILAKNSKVERKKYDSEVGKGKKEKMETEGKRKMKM